MRDMKNLDGKWRVEGKTGGLQALIGDIKYIDGTEGYNRLFGFKWGVFDIVWDEDLGRHIFTYRNGKIVDKVRFVNSDKLIGFFYLRGKRIGNFTMTRIK